LLTPLLINCSYPRLFRNLLTGPVTIGVDVLYLKAQNIYLKNNILRGCEQEKNNGYNVLGSTRFPKVTSDLVLRMCVTGVID